MKFFSCLLVFALSLLSFSQNKISSNFSITRLKYSGGGDWYGNQTSIKNLARFVSENTNLKIEVSDDYVDLKNDKLYTHPYIFMSGHGNVKFSSEEAENLKNYLTKGGFLHVDDDYGIDKFLRREMKKVFTDKDFVEIPFSHEIFSSHFKFSQGLPKIHEHDGKSPQAFGIFHEGRLVVLYTYECDLGDGWEDHTVHNDPETKHREALQMGTNIVVYALTH
ncbi:DUF4159 domain-containing protein [bacterium]|nr:DUF4159 domain-containing protein [bacterium]